MRRTVWHALLPMFIAGSALISGGAWGHGNDDPLLTKVMIDQLELRDAHGDDSSNPVALEAAAWIGMDLHKLWLKTDVELLNGKTTETEVQALYSHAIAPFWDLQMGVRHDSKPASRNWGVIGLQGTAPYFFDVDGALFMGESGAVGARFRAHRDVLITRQWILSPGLEVNAYGQNDRQTATGSGLADVEAGVRLRYEFRREFAPYMGVMWSKKFGNSATFARDAGEEVSATQWVVGLKVWF